MSEHLNIIRRHIHTQGVEMRAKGDPEARAIAAHGAVRGMRVNGTPQRINAKVYTPHCPALRKRFTTQRLPLLFLDLPIGSAREIEPQAFPAQAEMQLEVCLLKSFH